MRVEVLSESSVHVSWEPPLSHNGIITSYQVVVTDVVILSQSARYLTFPNERQIIVSTGIGE